MQTFTYGKASDTEKLTLELVNAGLALGSRFFGSSFDGTTTFVYGADDLSQAEIDTIDATVAAHVATPIVWPPSEFQYWQLNPDVTDSRTGKTAPFNVMESLVARRELFNDTDNPIYISSGFQQILGSGGWAQAHGDAIDNLDNIHAKMGWHTQEIVQATYRRPKDLLIYYGWLNSFNSAQNQWNNEKVAQDMAKYAVLVFGDGVQNPSHGDYANTSVIIPRVKALNPSALIFGYVTVNQSLANFQTKADQWDDLDVDGIFMDEAGYDYGKTRSDFNARVDYVHGLASANICFANAWNTDHVLGTTNDPSYPNSTYNVGLVASNLNTYDWILMESFPVNTAAYSGWIESKSDWAARGVKLIGLRATYGVNFAAVGVIDNSNASGSALAQFQFVSALQFSLEGNGTSDTGYGAGTAAVTYWARPDATGLGTVWSLNPSVQADVNSGDVYLRYVENGRLMLNFASGNQAGSITKT